ILRYAINLVCSMGADGGQSVFPRFCLLGQGRSPGLFQMLKHWLQVMKIEKVRLADSEHWRFPP
ncbi:MULTISPECIES: hypothetical protein, partial [unclassified Ruegeria]|uniref:hypothetical protein n=1 Tax=unclassified Ruegeria TaxID=2625375 RepID=UPI001C103153